MYPTNRTRALVTLLCVLAFAACGDRETDALTELDARPGELVVTLASPHDDDGALRLVIRGEGLGEPVAMDPTHHLFASHSTSGEGGLSIAVVGSGLSGDLVRVPVPDLNQLDRYRVELVEVSDQSNRLRNDLAAYTASLMPADASR